jgi:hypothetical protein
MNANMKEDSLKETGRCAAASIVEKRIRLGSGELTALEHIAIVTAFVLVLYGTYLGAHS